MFSSVKIRHRIDEITIPSNLPKKECIFNKREGLPIKISVESFLIMLIQCGHKINHNFRIPIESLIEWEIINGIKDGSFKHGYGLSRTYSDTNSENCVIYYPTIRGTKDDYKDKEIPILIRIRSNKIKESNENFSATDIPTSIQKSNDNVIIINIDPESVDNHFGKLPIYGVAINPDLIKPFHMIKDKNQNISNH